MAQRICMDSSLGFRLAFPEDLSQEARQLYLSWADAEIIVPASFFLECASAAYHKLKAGEATLQDVVESLGIIRQLPLDEVTPRDLMPRTAEIAYQLSISAWDAVYLAVAEAYDCAFWTADQHLHRVAGGQFPWVRLLMSGVDPDA